MLNGSQHAQHIALVYNNVYCFFENYDTLLKDEMFWIFLSTR